MTPRINALLSALPGLSVRVEPNDRYALVTATGERALGLDGKPLPCFCSLEGLTDCLERKVEARRDEFEARARAILPAFVAAEPTDPVVFEFAALCEPWAACKRALEESEATP